MTSDAADSEGLTAALGDVTERTRQLVRAEVEAVRRELQRKLVANVPGLMLGGVASGAGICALATVGYGAVATAASFAAVRRLRRAPIPFPEETVAATRNGVAAAASS